MIIPVQHDQVAHVWESIKQHVDAALETTLGQMTSEDVLRHLTNRDMQLWLVADGNIRGAMTTEVLVYPQMKILRVVTLGGEGWDEWGHEIVQTLDDYAKHLGASGIEFSGRKGWAAKLEKHGYSNRIAVFMKEIRNEHRSAHADE